MGASKLEITEFMRTEFPQSKCNIEEVAKNSATVSLAIGIDELRPGATVSGPVLMGVADVALYVAIHATIGITPLAVTTNLNINFLRKPSANSDIIGKCNLIKVGRKLIVGEVLLFSKGSKDIVAQVTGTYALP